MSYELDALAALHDEATCLHPTLRAAHASRAAAYASLAVGEKIDRLVEFIIGPDEKTKTKWLNS